MAAEFGDNKPKIMKPVLGRTDRRYEIGKQVGYVVIGHREVKVDQDNLGNLVIGPGRPASAACLHFWKLLGGPA